MLVQKFGGSSVADYRGFAASAAVIRRFAEQEPVVVVLSAVYGVTDLMIRAISEAEQGADYLVTLAEIARREAAVVEGMATAGHEVAGLREVLDARQRHLAGRLEGVRMLGRCPDESRAEILASGETLSSRMMALFLQLLGADARWSDTDVLPPANSSWLDTLVDLNAAAIRLKALMNDGHRVLVLPGFHSRNAQGRHQLLGRNGSDYSAAATAAALGARCCQIWKDVDGFFTADPSVVPNARVLKEVSYGEAMELTFFGAKVISSKALAPLAAPGIPCEIRNTYRPEVPGTIVHAGAAPSRPARGLSLLDHVATITLSGSGMRGRVGVAHRVMGALAANSISVLLIVQSSSEYSITLCVATAQAELARAALEAEFHFERMHGLIAEISLQTERAVITLVGDGMKHQRGIAARFLTANSAAGVNVEVIAQGSTECAISLVIDRRDSTPAMRASHNAFFGHQSPIDVVLIGCGNVGGALLEQFARQQDQLNASQRQLKVRAIANSRHLLVAREEVDLRHWREQLEAEGQPWEVEDVVAIRSKLGLLNPTIVDCTTNDALAGRYVEFLDAGFNVVCANKKANTKGLAYYRAMRESAGRNFRKFLYETNVGAGLPVIDTLMGLMRSGDELRVFEGILSGSLSQIFGRLEDGQPFSATVREAMALGFTEPDPRDDLSGMDVARKLLIVAREVGLGLELDDIAVEPVIDPKFAADATPAELPDRLAALDAGFAARVAEARERGAVLRYVARIEDGRCSVAIEAVPLGRPLASIREGENALVLQTDYYQPIPLVLRGYGAGARVTAAGVFADVLRTAWRPLDQ